MTVVVKPQPSAADSEAAKDAKAITTTDPLLDYEGKPTKALWSFQNDVKTRSFTDW